VGLRNEDAEVGVGLHMASYKLLCGYKGRVKEKESKYVCVRKGRKICAMFPCYSSLLLLA